jgi:hypothetical protein
VEKHEWPAVDAASFDQVKFTAVVGRDGGLDEVVEAIEGLTGRLVEALLLIAEITTDSKSGARADEGDAGGRNGPSKEE